MLRPALALVLGTLLLPACHTSASPASVDAGDCSLFGACAAGTHSDPATCQCVPDGDAAAPVDAGAADACLALPCPSGAPWDPATCTCVARDMSFCVDNVFCMVGSHWDPVACRCVSTADLALCTLGPDPLPCTNDGPCTFYAARCDVAAGRCVCGN
jgi:hypothetical protein